MKTPRIEGEYRSPMAEVIEMNAEGIICQSNPNEPETYEREEW